MSETDLGGMDVTQLVALYAAAAADQRRALEHADSRRANAAHDRVAATYRELRARGTEAQRALLGLLDDQDPGVRLWAGAHTLEFTPAEGEPALTELAASDGGSSPSTQR